MKKFAVLSLTLILLLSINFTLSAATASDSSTVNVNIEESCALSVADSGLTLTINAADAGAGNLVGYSVSGTADILSYSSIYNSSGNPYKIEVGLGVTQMPNGTELIVDLPNNANSNQVYLEEANTSTGAILEGLQSTDITNETVEYTVNVTDSSIQATSTPITVTYTITNE